MRTMKTLFGLAATLMVSEAALAHGGSHVEVSMMHMFEHLAVGGVLVACVIGAIKYVSYKRAKAEQQDK